ncbi:putative F-box/LRR-repeat protein At3g18150 [Carex rostrata]
MMEGRELARDIISGLPDPLLTHILSFIPIEEAVRTCILSKRWIKVWASLPTLVFDNYKSQYRGPMKENEHREAKFLRFLDGFMFNRETITLDTFKLTFYKIPFIYEWNTHILVCRFICCAVKCRPRILSIHIETGTFFNLPDSVFTCTSIEEMLLCLETTYIFDRDVLKLRLISLPFLKNLELGYMVLNDGIMRMLISGCPVLEELALYYCWFELNMISSNVLNKLEIIYCRQHMPMEISCPGVVSLTIRSTSKGGIILKNMSALATVGILVEDLIFPSDLDLRLLGGLSNVTTLKLHTNFRGAMDLLLADVPNCPTLKNLKSLELGEININYCWNLVTCLLQHSSNLKNLTLHFRRPSEYAAKEEFQGDISFRQEYLEAVKISCPGKNVKLVEELVHNMGALVKTTTKIIIL